MTQVNLGKSSSVMIGVNMFNLNGPNKLPRQTRSGQSDHVNMSTFWGSYLRQHLNDQFKRFNPNMKRPLLGLGVSCLRVANHLQSARHIQFLNLHV